MQVIVVDNGSTDATRTLVRAEFPQLSIVRVEENLGCPGGRNLAMSRADGEFILHLDDDGVLESSATAYAVAAAHSYPNAAVVMMCIEEFGICRLKAPTGTLLPYFSGGASLFRRSSLEQVGLYDPSFLRQGEEEDLLLRLYENGADVRYCHEAVMHHYPAHREGGPSSRSMREIAEHRLLNECVTAVRYYPSWHALRQVTLKTIGFCVRSIQARRAGEIPRVMRQLVSRGKSAFRSRTPLHRGFQRLKASTAEFRASAWPTKVPWSEATSLSASRAPSDSGNSIAR